MKPFPVSEAAKLVGKDRKTLYRAIKSGTLSATTDATGTTIIDLSELIRVYGKIEAGIATNATVVMPQKETPDDAKFVASMQAEISFLKAENNQLKERISDKDKHIEHIAQAMRLLENNVVNENSRWWKFWK
jgi:FtsZ-binding cell division protein ZapB